MNYKTRNTENTKERTQKLGKTLGKLETDIQLNTNAMTKNKGR